jgi:hypothetical protein
MPRFSVFAAGVSLAVVQMLEIGARKRSGA